MKEKISVIGSGSWGTTLAVLLSNKGNDVFLWSNEPEQLEVMQTTRENSKYLPGVRLPDSLKYTPDLAEAMHHARYLVMAVPSHAMREVCRRIAPFAHKEQYFISVAKGIENNTLQRMSEVISETLSLPPQQIATLSGPSHAEEVSRGIATAVVVGSVVLETARRARELFRTQYFRVYSSDDIVGVELGGSLKNVIAIAAGICDGAGFGDNTKAALLTRGLVEMTRLGVLLGARPETFAGLSGMGDLIVTCMSKHSRNRHVGEEIGKGRNLQEVLKEMIMVAEGVKTTRSVHQLSQKLGVEMPISEQVYQALFHNKKPQEAVYDLMTRDPKEETFE